MKKTEKTRVLEESSQTLTGLPQVLLAGVRGGDTTEPSPDDDNEMGGHLIDVG